MTETDRTLDPGLVDRILTRADEADKWQTVLDAAELRPVVEVHGHRLVASVGGTEYETDIRAVSVASAMIHNPRWTVQTARDEASHSASAIGESFGTSIVNAPKPQLADNEYDTARTLGFVRDATMFAAKLTATHPEETFEVMKLLAQTEPGFNVGVNPLRPAKEFYTIDGPVAVEGDDEDRSTDGPAQQSLSASAAEAGW